MRLGCPAFALRGAKSRWLYVAYSSQEDLLKIGVASDPGRRIAGPRRLGYGGAHDWELHGNFQVPDAGVGGVHPKQLADYSIPGTYTREGRSVD